MLASKSAPPRVESCKGSSLARNYLTGLKITVINALTYNSAKLFTAVKSLIALSCTWSSNLVQCFRARAQPARVKQLTRKYWATTELFSNIKHSSLLIQIVNRTKMFKAAPSQLGVYMTLRSANVYDT